MNTIKDFTDIIAPVDFQDFVSQYWNPKKHLLTRGFPEKFLNLLSWQKLNELILDHEHDTSGRLRLVKNDESIPLSKITVRETRRLRNGDERRLKGILLSQKLKEGAVLIFNRIDEVHEPIRRIAEIIEYALHERVYINMYAGWRASKGFNVHWDDHDVLIVQVHGEKHWTINGTSKVFPLYKEKEKILPPTGGPLWKGVIQAGDVLYIPRGCWHGAEACEGPTVHLTCGLYNQTGHDWLAWLQARVATAELFCQDLPRFGTNEERAAHMEKLRAAFLEIWDATTTTDFFVSVDEQAQPHERLSLPLSMFSVAETPLNDRTTILMRNPRPLRLLTGQEIDTVCFCAMGKCWTFRAKAKVILEFLDRRRQCSFVELTDAMRPEFKEATLTQLLRSLFREGLIFLRQQ